MLLCLSICNYSIAKQFNEMLEIAIERLDYTAVDLILEQTAITQDEKRIFLEQIQEIIDDLNEKIVPMGSASNSSGRIILAGLGLSGLGVAVYNMSTDRYYHEDTIGMKLGRTMMVSGVLAGVIGVVKFFRGAYKADCIELAKSQLQSALWIKSALIRARIKS